MRLKSLTDLYHHELRDLRSARQQLLDVLPGMQKAASDDGLKKLMASHGEAVRRQIDHLDRILEAAGEKPQGVTCRGMAGMVAELDDFLAMGAADEVRDAGLVANAQRMEHYALAGFGAVRTYAKMLGEDRAASFLQTMLDEAGMMNHALMDLARQRVNREAEKVS